MHAIHLRSGTSNDGMTAEQFRQKVIDISNDHRKKGRALVFAFLLFDRRHAQVGRILDDRRFYESLNQIAGQLLTVFFIHSQLRRPNERRDFWADEAEQVAKVLTDQFDIGRDWNREKP